VIKFTGEAACMPPVHRLIAMRRFSRDAQRSASNESSKPRKASAVVEKCPSKL